MNLAHSAPSYESRIKLIFHVLQNRNYRFFFIGLGISLVGGWMQRIAMSWLVYRLTNSAFLLGVVAFAGLIPSFLLAPLAGVMVDRWNRYYVIFITQILLMAQALILGFLVLSDLISIWQIICLSIFLGIVSSLNMPARQSFVIELIEKKQYLGNAIALNSIMFNSARLIGPSVGGIIIASNGEGVCFLINGITYLAVIIALLAINIKPKKRKVHKISVLKGLKEGFTYVFGIVPIRSIILLLGMANLIGVPCLILMPIFAKDILHGGPHTLGFLTGASGVGALIGAIFLALRKGMQGLEKVIPLSVLIFGIGLITFSLSRTLWISMILMVIIGLGMVVQMASSNTVLQAIVDDDKRGRVMSFYNMAILGVAPFGSLLIGSMASKISTIYTFLLGGGLCFLFSLLFVGNRSKRLSLIHKNVSQSNDRTG